MSYTVNFENVSTIGLKSSPVAKSLAGLRANEARYFKNKYQLDFTVVPASDSQKTVDYVSKILKEERDIVIEAKPLEVITLNIAEPRFGETKWTFVFYENGLEVNVLYPLNEPKGRAVGFKLSEGMEIPNELSNFKFARQRSKLAGIIRGSYFKIKKEY